MKQKVFVGKVDQPKWMDTNLFPFRDYSMDERERMFELYTDAVKRGIITEITAPQLRKLRRQGSYPDQCPIVEEILWFEQNQETDDHAAQNFIDNEISTAIDNLKYFDFERNYLLHKDKVYSTESEFVGLYAHLFKDLLKRQSSEIIELYMTTNLYLSFFHEHLRFFRFVFEESRPAGMKPSGTLQRLFFEHGKDSVREPAKMLSYYLKNPRVENEDAYLVSYIESQVNSSTPLDLDPPTISRSYIDLLKYSRDTQPMPSWITHMAISRREKSENSTKKDPEPDVRVGSKHPTKKCCKLYKVEVEQMQELIMKHLHKSSNKANCSAIVKDSIFTKLAGRYVSHETVRNHIGHLKLDELAFPQGK